MKKNVLREEMASRSLNWWYSGGITASNDAVGYIKSLTHIHEAIQNIVIRPFVKENAQVRREGRNCTMDVIKSANTMFIFLLVFRFVSSLRAMIFK